MRQAPLLCCLLATALAVLASHGCGLDAGDTDAPSDTGMGGVDASAPIDAGPHPHDASPATLDAASNPGDAESIRADAEMSAADAEPSAPDVGRNPDAAPSPPDTGSTPADAAQSPADAASIPHDASQVQPDATPTPPDAGQPPPDSGSTGPVCIRAVNGNLSTGNHQSYDPGEGLRIFKGLTPDVIMIQEFNYGDNSAATIDGIVASTFGAGFAVFHETGTAIQIPNGIISRYPIISSGSWTDSSVANRGFAWAEIAIPGPTHLWAVSLHLLTSSAANRDAEATQIVNYVKQNIPAGDYLVIGGDLNSGTRSEACIGTLSAVVSVAAPYPVDQSGNANTSGYSSGCGSSGRSKPHDWVMPNAALLSHESAVKIGANSFPHGLVFDSCVYTPLTDVPPILQSDSGGDSMQHMAVVREFCVP